MDLGLKGKTAIVAASSKGLGFEIAKALAEEGVNVSICARNEGELIKARETIVAATGADVLAVKCDLTIQEDIKNLVDKTIEAFGDVHILVNNSGGPPTGFFTELPLDEWLKAVKLNLMSTVTLSKHVLPYMIKNRWGRIINSTSFSVKQPIEGLILSNSIRLAVIGFAKTLANEVGKYNITVNNVCPGYFKTDRVIQLAKNKAEKMNTTVENVFKEWESQIPLGRLGEPREYAELVVFLASERASYITGATIQIDGGIIKSSL
ncbi:MAG: SDR family oxidoreductase [Candidatus Odinarchaeum yellowstonii]|uniref:SDR family oxidoreductase n=1 Tax=Odinarchaeota yellowstonii (strain LCB_4) TaxID=1841599 RepID=A0AAF0D3A9_ODILC|nr:MAG: SDR family oxidoreductase [Candidatus Odinarchaeum yellowstonii]